ncbi:ribosomal RNA small subunit methyltransferase A [Patescibacteria group bacterium]|nr:MAG: ribosomal RNA small subunit methyltransferase A [Patescibacteria group bacterium]
MKTGKFSAHSKHVVGSQKMKRNENREGKPFVKKFFWAKKSLGQHFLHSPGIFQKIVAAAKIKSGERVLEVGPGKGNLTTALLNAGARVVTVEKDDRLIPLLQERFVKEIKSGDLKIIHGDILEMDLRSVFRGQRYKIVANIPYYITGRFLKEFLSSKNQPNDMILLLQKEVAERIVARDKKESILSISVKTYGTPRIVSIVKRGNFFPPPKVDSAILAVEDISRKNFRRLNEKKFFEIVRAGFSQKRKKLSRVLEREFEREEIEKSFTACRLNLLNRPENLSAKDWLCLSKHL